MGFFAVDYKFVTNKPSLKGKVAQRSCDGRLKALKNVFYLAKFEKSKSLYYNFFPKNAIYCVLIKVSLEPLGNRKDICGGKADFRRKFPDQEGS